jgi:hypothetical protein
MSSHEFFSTNPPRGTNVEDNAQRSAPRRYDARVHNRALGSGEFLGSPDKTLCFPNQHHEHRRPRQMPEAHAELRDLKKLPDAGPVNLRG